MSTLALLPLAAALWAAELPEPERIARLSPMFSPRPGAEVTLSARELRDLRKTVPHEKMRGVIKVTPPPGICLIVQRQVDQPDTRVCKPTELAFTLTDLDRAGRIVWKISTDDGDYPTPLSWPTPYRTGIVTPFDRDPVEPPLYRFIERCEAERSQTGRRLKIKLFDGETWVVSLPVTDKLVPQPDAIPNLYMAVAGGKVSVKDAAKQKEAEKSHKEAVEAGAPVKDHAAAAPEPEKNKTPDQYEDRQVWSIPARGSYEMPGSGFMPYGSVAPGGVGKCRYNFRGSAEDPETGRLECQQVDGFRHVLLPLTCLGDLADTTKP